MSEKLGESNLTTNPKPVCTICGDPHKTSRHDLVDYSKKGVEDTTCELCGRPHDTSQHPPSTARTE